MAAVDRRSAAFAERVELAMAYTDFDYAYELQLQEALAASTGVDVEEVFRTAEFELDKGDSSLAARLQDEELSRVEMEVSDSVRAAMEAARSVHQLKQCLHDKRVAQNISDMPEEEWEDRGDEYELPFEEESGSSGGSPAAAGVGAATAGDGDVFVLYFHGTLHPDRTGAGVGWVLYDAAAADQVIWRQSRLVGGSPSALDAEYAALIDGLGFVRNLGIRRVRALGSSQLVCKQVLLNYPVGMTV